MMATPLTPTSRALPVRQKGVVLIVALILLLVLTLIGIGVTQSTSLEERMAANARDKDLSFQAAEAGLRTGESGLEQALYTNFDNTNGLYEYDPTQADIWTTIDWTKSANVVSSSAVSLASVAQQPVFIIEQLPPVPAPGQNLGATEYGDTPTIQLYRITALGTGGDTTSQSMLQTVYQP